MAVHGRPECPSRMARSPPKHWIPASGAGAHSRASSITGVTNRQQLDREPDPADCHWTRQLIVCGLAQRRAACGCGHESDPECQAQWAQSLCLSERCAAAPAHAQEQSGCRIIASSLAACPDVTADRLTIAATVAARGFRPPPTPYRPFDICSPPLAGFGGKERPNLAANRRIEPPQICTSQNWCYFELQGFS